MHREKPTIPVWWIYVNGKSKRILRNIHVNEM
jgi:hypothetical protein